MRRSCLLLRQVDTGQMALPFLVIREKGEIVHPHRIENAVEMVDLVLDDPRVKAGGRLRDRAAVQRPAGQPHAAPARDGAPPTGYREAALPARRPFWTDRLQDWTPHGRTRPPGNPH